MVDRRRFLTLAGTSTLGMTALSGCLSGGNSGSGNGNDGGNDSDGGGNGSSSSGGGGSGSETHVGMVYALGGLGDKSFNDMANRGVKKAKRKLGISYKNAQPSKSSQFATFQRRFAQSKSPKFDLICCIGFAQTSALSKIAPNFPDQNFMLVDSVVEEPNVASYTFKEHQGSFQVGHLAGLLTTRKMNAGAGKTNPKNTTVGFVGGKEVPLIKKFEAGYRAGVKHANKQADVKVAYTGSFSDAGAGKEAAISMYANGADIVYHAAGGAGIGVFQAAQERGRYAIGVDAPQSRSEPKFADVILASMVKRVNRAVFRSVKNVVNGNFKGGKTTTLGLKQNGVEAVYGKKLGDDIPKEIKQALEESRKKIISGKIQVPQKPSKL